MEFKDRIRELRIEADLSTTQMATIFSKSEAAIRAWETGRTKPDADTLVEISRHFGCTTDFLLGISGFRAPEEKDSLKNDLQELLSNLERYAFSRDYPEAINTIIRLSEKLSPNENIWYFSCSIVSMTREILVFVSDLLASPNDENTTPFDNIMSTLEKIVEHKEVLDMCVGVLFAESLKPVWRYAEKHNKEVDLRSLSAIFSGLTDQRKLSNKYISERVQHLKAKAKEQP